MKHTTYMLIVFLAIIFGCNDTGETLLCYQGTVPCQEYWLGMFDVDRGAQIKIDFLSNKNLDVLLMDDSGFSGFKQRVGNELITHKEWYLEMEEFGTCTLIVQTLDSLYISAYQSYWTIPKPIDIYLFDSVCYDLYLQWQNVYGYCNYFFTVGEMFNFTPNMIEDLFLVIDNTSAHGTMPVGSHSYEANIYKYIAQPFDYYANGSVLNIDSASILFDIPMRGTYYLIINNAGYVENGAVPSGDVNFTIEVKQL